jgi:purine nucleosidase
MVLEMPKKIILDCDPGHDDAVAIMFAAASNEIELLGITCVGGNVGLDNTVNNALKVCTLIERTDLKVFSGAKKPIHYDLFTAEYVHGKTGLDKKGDPIEVSSNYKVQDQNAVDFIVETCRSSTDQIYLCPTGPLTNIALSLQKDPSIKKKIK